MVNILKIMCVVLLAGCVSAPHAPPEQQIEISFDVDWDCINQFDEPLPFLHPEC